MVTFQKFDLVEQPVEAYRNWKLQDYSFGKDVRILNYTGKTIYVCDGINVHAVRPLVASRSYDKFEAHVIIRTIYTERNISNVSYESKMLQDSTYEPRNYDRTITLSDLENTFKFSEDLNLVIGLDREDVMKNHPTNPKNIEKRINDATEISKNSQIACPIRLELNDPMKRIDKVYVVWGGNISRHTVYHSDVLGELFKIHRVNHLGNCISEEYNLSDFLLSKTGLDLNSGDVFVTDNLQQATQHQYKFKEGPENEKIGAITADYERRILKLNQKLDDATHELTRLKELEQMRIKNHHDKLKYYVSERKLESSLESDKVNRETESIKFQKEQVSSTSSQTSDVLKIVGAGIALTTAIIVAVVKLSSKSKELAIVSSVAAVGGLIYTAGQSLWRSLTSWF